MSRFDELVESLTERSDKQLRTLRNNLNNRLSSFNDEDRFGRVAKELKESHPLSGLGPGECKELLQVVAQEMKRRRFSSP